MCHVYKSFKIPIHSCVDNVATDYSLPQIPFSFVFFSPYLESIILYKFNLMVSNKWFGNKIAVGQLQGHFPFKLKLAASAC